KIEDHLEAAGVAVVRIRHLEHSKAGRILHEKLDLSVRPFGFHGLQFAQVIPVHRQNEIEAFEVALGDLTRPQSADIDAAPQSRALAARVGRGSCVVRGGARRINLDLQVRRFLRRQVPQHRLRRRASADVAQAHQQHPKWPRSLSEYSTRLTWNTQTGSSCSSIALTRSRSSGVSTPAGGILCNTTRCMCMPYSKARSCSSFSVASSGLG